METKNKILKKTITIERAEDCFLESIVEIEGDLGLDLVNSNIAFKKTDLGFWFSEHVLIFELINNCEKT